MKLKALVAVLLCSPLLAQAVPIVDQSNLPPTSNPANFPVGAPGKNAVGFFQSFTNGLTGQLTGIDVFLSAQQGTAPDTVFLGVHSSHGLEGGVFGFTTMAGSLIAPTPGFVHFDLTSQNIFVSAGTLRGFHIFRNPSGQPPEVPLQVVAYGSDSNAYGRGAGCDSLNSTCVDGSGNLDIFFRTYVDPINVVPEPGSLALLGLGIAGMLASRRRKAG